MKSKFFLRLIILISVFFTALPVLGAPVPKQAALDWAEDKGRLLLETFHEPDIRLRYQKLDQLFLENVDLDYVAQFVAGRYWRQMSEPQRQTYLDLFKRYALSIYKNFPLDFADSIHYQVTGAIPDHQFTVVSALVNVQLSPTQPAENFLLNFRLSQKNDQIYLLDIKLAESSLILAYRNKFAAMFNEVDGDIGWFLEDLDTLTRSNEKNNQLKILR